MNCGLGNLDGLKKHVLGSGTMAGDKRFDDVIQDIGLGVAGMIENFCNRSFARMVADTAIFQADRASFVLPRFPLEAVTGVAIRIQNSEAFVDQDVSIIQSVSLASGIVYMPEPSDQGEYWSQIKFTFTGGFFFEQLEPDDAAYPSDVPAGAKRLPPDVRLAWLLQSREVWSKIDKAGLATADAPGAQSKTDTLDLSPIVKRMLANYVVMQPI